MTDRITEVLRVTATDWNLPGYVPGFCWREYVSRADTPAAMRTAASLRVNRKAPGIARAASYARWPEVAEV